MSCQLLTIGKNRAFVLEGSLKNETLCVEMTFIISGSQTEVPILGNIQNLPTTPPKILF